MFDFSKLKLVIWDLDDTFWSGTLSEEGVKVNISNITLVKDLTDRGIINSICSKNDIEPVENQLRVFGCDEFFVFKSVDWTPKGMRIKNLIQTMGLRPVNCLFIDDNVVNLNEAKYYSPELMIAEPQDVLPLLESYVKTIEPKDKSHSRLNQYKILEQKEYAKNATADNLSFLYSTNTKVAISYDCFNVLDRIHELVNRTNQLNFTKVRLSREELEVVLSDSSITSGYVTVKDNFGDYGIVGFFSVKDHKLIHFLFSCRTIGQGVEQWVYSQLGYPELSIVGEVINTVNKDEVPAWINQEKDDVNINNKSEFSNKKIVFKGACDLEIMASFLKSTNIITEFTYIGEKKKNRIEHHNHSINYLSFPFLSDKEKSTLLEDCIFNDEEMFNTSMYDKDVAILFLSTQIEPNLGIYRNKQTGLSLAFGEYKYPLTDKKNWEYYIKGFAYHNTYTEQWLNSFSNKYEFIGRLTPNDFITQLSILLSKLPTTTKVCLLLGSEMPYLANTSINYEDRHIYYKELNDLLKIYVKDKPRVMLIDFNDYLKSQEDFTDNINHYQRRIYYMAACKANEYIANEFDSVVVKPKGKIFLFKEHCISLLKYSLNKESKLFKILSKIYALIK